MQGCKYVLFEPPEKGKEARNEKKEESRTNRILGDGNKKGRNFDRKRKR